MLQPNINKDFSCAVASSGYFVNLFLFYSQATNAYKKFKSYRHELMTYLPKIS